MVLASLCVINLCVRVDFSGFGLPAGLAGSLLYEKRCVQYTLPQNAHTHPQLLLSNW